MVLFSSDKYAAAWDDLIGPRHRSGCILAQMPAIPKWLPSSVRESLFADKLAVPWPETTRTPPMNSLHAVHDEIILHTHERFRVLASKMESSAHGAPPKGWTTVVRPRKSTSPPSSCSEEGLSQLLVSIWEPRYIPLDDEKYPPRFFSWPFNLVSSRVMIE